ncbi:MAG: hypothetical protein KJ804_02065 [Proteobacteria bacterium]|nr:hypothetical protein [Pseudomonadota bacterium]
MKKLPAKKDRRQARAWMILQGIRQKDIQNDLGQRHETQVNETLLGLRNDRRVLQYLLDNGCPAGYLELPSDMFEAA